MLFANSRKPSGILPPDVRVLSAAPPPPAPPASPKAAVGTRPLLKPGATTGLRLEQRSARCRHKGCVFPAQPGSEGECADHRRRSLEPACFQSQQPTSLLLDQARFGLPDSEPDTSRAKDRQRLTAERVRFLLEDVA